jgi:HD-GYP domain-containing protein (c-di-GMP phosphodiesterase class II)
MRQVSIEQLKTGDRLGRNVYGGSEHLVLLCAGVRVSDSYCQSLRRAGITSVWIDDGLSEGIEPEEVLGEATKQRATAAIRTAFRDVTDSLASGGRVSSGAVQEMQDVAEMIVTDVSRSVHSALALNDLANSDGYTLKHSLAVTTLGLSLGVRVMQKYGWVDAHGKRRYDGIDDRLAVLGVGLLLHDIGKLAVPPDILRKPGKLTDDEWKAMRAHPMLGIKILKSADGISPLARAVVRSHHERWNGGGYPDGMTGLEIHQFARIAAVADVFDALTSDRAYRPALPTPEVYEYISSRSGKEFDPEVVSVFRSFVAPYPVGTTVLLSDGSTGIVKEVKPDVVTRPIVRVIADAHGGIVTPREIDLSITPDVRVVSTNLELPVPVVA